MIVFGCSFVVACIAGFVSFMETEDWGRALFDAFSAVCAIVIFLAFFIIIRYSTVDWAHLWLFFERVDNIVIWGK